jgi:uncharacterized protein YegL
MSLDIGLTVNPSPRCACLLLLDTSQSMNGEPIQALNAGLQAFQADIQEDGLARQRVEIAILTFGGVVTPVQEFASANSFAAPALTAGGNTPMGQAILEGVRMVKSRKQEYKDHGILYYQPWIFMITDGAPTDEWRQAADLVRAETAARGLAFFAVAVNHADVTVLKAITDRVLKLDGINFRELFLWLSASQRRVSTTQTQEQAELPATTFGSPV